jgi:hypothetical protein
MQSGRHTSLVEMKNDRHKIYIEKSSIRRPGGSGRHGPMMYVERWAAMGSRRLGFMCLDTYIKLVKEGDSANRTKTGVTTYLEVTDMRK